MPAGLAETARCAAILLAAGRSRRFLRGHKLLADFNGAPLWWAALSACCASRASPVIVVLGARRAALSASLRQFRTRLRRPVRMRVVVNRHSARGMASSLQLGLKKVPADRAGALVMLADMPGVHASTLDALMAAHRPGDQAVVPVRQGRRGNPVLLSRSLFEPLSALTGDEGARRVLRSTSAVRELAVDPLADTSADIDTRRDHIRLQRRRRPR